MDLTAIAGSQALVALQALANSNAATSSVASTSAASTTSTQSVEATGVGAGAALYATSQGISHALSAADAASSAGQGVLGLLDQMRQAAAQAGDGALATSARQALDQTFQANAAAVAPTLQTATVGGVNLVDGSMSGALKVGLGDGSQASVSGLDLRAGGSALALDGATLASADDATTTHARVAAAIQGASSALANLQTEAGALAAHAALLQSQGQGATTSSTDDSGDGARLLALQVSQQLSTQAGAVANAAPQQVLALFRT